MPYKNGNIVWNATEWTNEMEEFLKANYMLKTNVELAAALKLNLTVTRNKMRELGLKRMQLEYWTAEQIKFLKDNYKTMGDVEIMHYFKLHFPKQKGWTRKHIHKKRKQLGLFRTGAEIKIIASNNSKPGGRSFTILKNSSSSSMADGWIAVTMARTNAELRSELLKHPDLLEAKRVVLQVKRIIKQKQKIVA